jgi:mono/diheme cytochrome c family protein
VRQVLLLAVVVAGTPGGCAGHRAATAPAPSVSVPVAVPEPSAAVPPVETAAPEAVRVEAAATRDAFRAEIAPLLAKRCAPCHNPGGKMYDKLPFDDPATVAGHPEGILKRIKDPAEHGLIERWIAEQSKS